MNSQSENYLQNDHFNTLQGKRTTEQVIAVLDSFCQKKQRLVTVGEIINKLAPCSPAEILAALRLMEHRNELSIKRTGDFSQEWLCQL